MANLSNITGPGVNVDFEENEAYMTCATATLDGEVLQVDETVVTTAFGKPRFTTILTPTAVTVPTVGGVQSGIFCIVRGNFAAGSTMVKVQFRGTIKAIIEDTAVAIGTQMIAKATVRALDIAAAAATNPKVIAKCLELTTSTAQKKWVVFNGVEGFGSPGA